VPVTSNAIALIVRLGIGMMQIDVSQSKPTSDTTWKGHTL